MYNDDHRKPSLKSKACLKSPTPYLLIFPAAPVEPGLAIVRPLRDVMVKAGESVLFECHVIGPQDVDVDWLSDGKLIQPALLNCKMHFDGKRCRLLLNSVHEDDSGTYTCKLSTAKGEHLQAWQHGGKMDRSWQKLWSVGNYAIRFFVSVVTVLGG